METVPIEVKPIEKALKRLLDIVGAGIALIVLLPFFVLLAILIRLDSPGSIFFLAPRAGQGNKVFYPFKFRSMEDGAMRKGLKQNIEKNDRRITRIGVFLRRFGIDELPQLLNVLFGDMSLVGPRPALAYQAEQYTEFQKKRLQMKPGLTGLAIIKGRNALSWQERIEYDVWYVEHWSFLLDIKIIFLTPFIIFSGKGVYGKDGVNDDPFLPPRE